MRSPVAIQRLTVRVETSRASATAYGVVLRQRTATATTDIAGPACHLAVAERLTERSSADTPPFSIVIAFDRRSLEASLSFAYSLAQSVQRDIISL